MFEKALIQTWRIDPDQDRGCSKCITRKMTPEEIKKYGPPAQRNEHNIASVKYLNCAEERYNAKITKEQLLAECRKLGTDTEACKEIAEKYGYSGYTAVYQRIRNLGIKEILKEEVQQGGKVRSYDRA